MNHPCRTRHLPALSALGLLVIGLLAVLAHGMRAASGPVAVARHDLRAAGASATPWQLVQVSDLHLQAFGPHERALARQVKELAAAMWWCFRARPWIEPLPCLRCLAL